MPRCVRISLITDRLDLGSSNHLADLTKILSDAGNLQLEHLHVNNYRSRSLSSHEQADLSSCHLPERPLHVHHRESLSSPTAPALHRPARANPEWLVNHAPCRANHRAARPACRPPPAHAISRDRADDGFVERSTLQKPGFNERTTRVAV
jgi:hypothetical protein